MGATITRTLEESLLFVSDPGLAPDSGHGLSHWRLGWQKQGLAKDESDLGLHAPPVPSRLSAKRAIDFFR